MWRKRRYLASMVARAAIAASFTTRVVSRNCPALRNLGSCSTQAFVTTGFKGIIEGYDRSARKGLCAHVQAPVPETHYGQLSGPEDSDVSALSRQTGADARRKRPGEVRGLRTVRGGLPGGRDLSRSRGERRHGDGRPALRVHLPDSQDPLHLLRLLRRGLPGVGDFHEQGLRARRLQQGRLRVGQDGAASAGGGERESAERRSVNRID